MEARLSKSQTLFAWVLYNLCMWVAIQHMEFTCLMNANTIKYFYNYFMGMHEANSNKPLKNIKKISGIERLVLPFPDT